MVRPRLDENVQGWRRRMGIEPTWELIDSHTGFEDQERHQAPFTPGKNASVNAPGGQAFSQAAGICARQALPLDHDFVIHI